jgi:hypothetical protein
VSPSPITVFYCRGGIDHRGRDLDRLQNQTLNGLERAHDYIQWLFPLRDRSSANPHAPRLDDDDIRAFNGSDALRANLVRSLEVMLRFYGLAMTTTPGCIDIRRYESFDDRKAVWLVPFNHNFLRITRILKSLTLLGCKDHARALFVCLEGIYRECPSVIGQETFRCWQSALGRQ